MPKVTPIADVVAAERARDGRRSSHEPLREQPKRRARLPHGAKLEARWDEHAVRWTGSLTARGQTVTASCGALSTLQHVLDAKLRARLGIGWNGTPLAAGPSEHHGREDLACPACGTDSTVGCYVRTEPSS